MSFLLKIENIAKSSKISNSGEGSFKDSRSKIETWLEWLGWLDWLDWPE